MTNNAMPFHLTASRNAMLLSQAHNVNVQKRPLFKNAPEKSPNDIPISNARPGEMGIVLLQMLCISFARPIQTHNPILNKSRKTQFVVLPGPHRKNPRIPCAIGPRRNKSTLAHRLAPDLFDELDLHGDVENLDEDRFRSSKYSTAPSSCPNSAAGLRFLRPLPHPSIAELTDRTDLRDSSEVSRLSCGPLADRVRSAATAPGVNGEGETRQDALPLPVPDSPTDHRLGLFAIRIPRRGLRKVSELPVLLAGSIWWSLMVEGV